MVCQLDIRNGRVVVGVGGTRYPLSYDSIENESVAHFTSGVATNVVDGVP